MSKVYSLDEIFTLTFLLVFPTETSAKRIRAFFVWNASLAKNTTWLPDKDSNLDTMDQNHVSYH